MYKWASTGPRGSASASGWADTALVQGRLRRIVDKIILPGLFSDSRDSGVRVEDCAPLLGLVHLVSSSTRVPSSCCLLDGVVAWLVVQLTDFGLSRWLDTGQRTHLSTRTFGTIPYMPAELLNTGRLTKAVDVYSFGIIMCELYSKKVWHHAPHQPIALSSYTQRELFVAEAYLQFAQKYFWLISCSTVTLLHVRLAGFHPWVSSLHLLLPFSLSFPIPLLRGRGGEVVPGIAQRWEYACSVIGRAFVARGSCRGDRGGK